MARLGPAHRERTAFLKARAGVLATDLLHIDTINFTRLYAFFVIEYVPGPSMCSGSLRTRLPSG